MTIVAFRLNCTVVLGLLQGAAEVSADDTLQIQECFFSIFVLSFRRPPFFLLDNFFQF